LTGFTRLLATRLFLAALPALAALAGLGALALFVGFAARPRPLAVALDELERLPPREGDEPCLAPARVGRFLAFLAITD
jgi:hypothetical protein